MDPQSNAYQRAIGVLERLGNPELLDTYKRYVARLEAALGPAWMDTYASMYQRDGQQLMSKDEGPLLLPEETTLRDRALADPDVAGLAQQFITLLTRNRLIDERFAD